MSDERWDFYFCELEGRVATVGLDLAWGDAERAAERAARPVVALVQLRFETARADGLPDPDAGAGLARVEDAVIEALAARDARLVGRITTAGRRDYFFLAREEGGLAALLEGAFAAGGHAPARVAVRRDPEGLLYREVLAPGPEELRWMADRRAVERLVASGDDPSRPRPVAHRLGFDDAAGRDRFAAEAAALGFRVEPAADAPGAVLHREDPVELDGVHRLCLDLDARARAHGGRHEGWSAGPVIG